MYTPGPIEVRPYPNPDFAYALWKGGVRVALVDRRPQLAVAEEADNAFLYAGAPGLVAALEGIQGMHVGPDTNHRTLSSLCMAIAATALAELAAAQGAGRGEWRRGGQREGVAARRRATRGHSARGAAGGVGP